MKIRTSYVSNSSSSSYVIAYDPSFFGDIEHFFKDTELGFETNIGNIKEFLANVPEYRTRVEAAEVAGKKVLYMWLDYDYCPIIDLLEQINEKNGGDKLEVLYEEDE